MRFVLPLAASAAALAFAMPAAAQAPWSVEGSLANGDQRDADHHLYDTHQVFLNGGQRYRISVQSPEGGFDTLLRLFRPGANEPVATNDDAGGTLNSRIDFTPPQSGVYLIRVSSFAADGRGAYTARVETLAPLPPPITAAPTRSERLTWRIWEGALSDDDADADGHHYDDYLVHVRAGQTRFITLDALGEGDAAFDTMIQILRAEAREGGEVVDSDDDGGAGLNSMLGFTPEADGDYIVRVTSFTDGAKGRYRLRISDPD
jgi:Bacterial pre-peptidase C-terminal domain